MIGKDHVLAPELKQAIKRFGDNDTEAMLAGRTLAASLIRKYPEIHPKLLAELLSDMMTLYSGTDTKKDYLRLIGGIAHAMVEKAEEEEEKEERP